MFALAGRKADADVHMVVDLAWVAVCAWGSPRCFTRLTASCLTHAFVTALHCTGADTAPLPASVVDNALHFVCAPLRDMLYALTRRCSTYLRAGSTLFMHLVPPRAPGTAGGAGPAPDVASVLQTASDLMHGRRWRACMAHLCPLFRLTTPLLDCLTAQLLLGPQEAQEGPPLAVRWSRVAPAPAPAPGPPPAPPRQRVPAGCQCDHVLRCCLRVCTS